VKAETDMVLIYSCHAAKDIVFKTELEELRALNKDFKLVLSVTNGEPSWNGLVGRIDADMVKREIPDFAERLFFLSGPTAMVLDLRGILVSMGVQDGQIKQDLFTGFEKN
jgi:ferredoxin-NADP reductase